MVATVMQIDPTRPSPGRRLGSAATDTNGEFSIELAMPSGAESVDIALVVTAPEGSAAPKPLATTTPRTVRAGREAFLLWIADAELRMTGVERPRDAASATTDPVLVLARAASDATRRAELTSGASTVHAPHIAAQRAKSSAARKAVEARLLADLGMTRPGRRRVALPGADLAGPVGDAIRDGLTNVRAAGPSMLRLTITEPQLEALRDAPGSPALLRERVEAIAFAGGARRRTRHDAIAHWCAQLTHTLPSLDEPLPPTASVGTATPVVDLDGALTTIVDEIARRIAPTIEARTDLASLRGRLRSLELAGGPADRTAFFDYGMLIGTIDGVWQELLDQDVLENAADLYETVSDAGGSTTPDATPLLTHLAHEVRTLHAAGAPGVRLTTRGATADARRPVTGSSARSVIEQIFGSRPQAQDHRPLSTWPWPTPQHPPPPVTRPPSTPPSRSSDPIDPPTPEYAALLAELNERLAEPYAFQVFAANGDTRAIDFGLFVTYRQRWEPQPNQAGALVKTITLTPREERTYATRTTYKRSTTAVRATNIENQRRSESDDSTKEASDVVNAAKSSMGFEVSTSGSVEVGELFSGEASATTTRNSERASQESRQLVRESVRRAAQEAKESTRVEVTTNDTTEGFHEETGKLINANDELAVTYLFFELQRRFRVSERVHEMVPVVMVARPVPSPDKITRGWLFTHGWILQRALMDDQFKAPLHYLLNEAAGVEARLGELHLHLNVQRDLVATLKEEVDVLAKQTATRYGAVAATFATLLATQRDESTEGFLEKGWEAVMGGGESVETARLREQMAKEAYDQALRNERDGRDRLGQAVSTLESATRDYSEALALFRDKELSVRRVRIHVKQHILHYMRAIWNMEDRDQRFFELHSVRVPRLAGHLDYRVGADPAAPPVPPLWQPPIAIEATLVPDVVDPATDMVALIDVADLEHPLGYKGNFMVFPMRQHNVLTKFLALPYLDDRVGARDPDLHANFTRAELDQYVACARRVMPREHLAALMPRIHALYQALLDRPFPDEEEIVVPTGQTIVEALPSTQPVLEDFRLLHRALDVSKAAAEVRHRELENLRRVARICDGRLADPDIEAVVVAPNGAGVVVAPPGTNAGTGRENG